MRKLIFPLVSFAFFITSSALSAKECEVCNSYDEQSRFMLFAVTTAQMQRSCEYLRDGQLPLDASSHLAT